MMTNDFNLVMQQRSDRELAEILSIKRHEYQETAILAAQSEFEKRHLSIDQLISAEEFARIEEKTTPAPLPQEEQKLSVGYKILTLLSLLLVYWIWGFIAVVFLENSHMDFFTIPVTIIAQILVFQQLKNKGYIRMAKDFKVWIAYSWIVFLAGAILIYLFENITERFS